MGNLGFPFRPYHPGELLKEELECRHISQKSLAKQLDIPYTAFNEVLNCKRPVSPDLALLLEAALGINAGLLVRLQTDYNLQIATQDKTLAERLVKIKQIAAIL